MFEPLPQPLRKQSKPLNLTIIFSLKSLPDASMVLPHGLVPHTSKVDNNWLLT